MVKGVTSSEQASAGGCITRSRCPTEYSGGAQVRPQQPRARELTERQDLLISASHLFARSPDTAGSQKMPSLMSKLQCYSLAGSELSLHSCLSFHHVNMDSIHHGACFAGLAANTQPVHGGGWLMLGHLV